jgi:hypothetical protein
MPDAQLGTGEIASKIYPDFKRRFAIFQIATNAIEARFDDGSRPVRAEVGGMGRGAIGEALGHALSGAVVLDCPRLKR